ncbi:MAG: bifunctional adenosylcobinamide kinase/adenosylcobinamide-phosphate guanylyltransferase, partial [Deltaproteobacteria bacterium]|nr:bifunctional adenosylcobinamide kinase/adenosylcobinamide-phosphate guanylyltransferase [Deltaproteobacteria bacterium]
MDGRIALHQQRRAGKGWLTVEEPLDLAQALMDTADSAVVLVDCLTLWINNLLYDADCLDKTLSEEQIVRCCQQVIEACKAGDRTIIFVTNELGMGIVPADA